MARKVVRRRRVLRTTTAVQTRRGQHLRLSGGVEIELLADTQPTSVATCEMSVKIIGGYRHAHGQTTDLRYVSANEVAVLREAP